MNLSIKTLTRVGVYDYEVLDGRSGRGIQSVPVWCRSLPGVTRADWRALIVRDLAAKGYDVTQVQVTLLLDVATETTGLYFVTALFPP